MTNEVSFASLPYHEPSIITIITQASLLLLLNVINYALDRVVYCGLLGQVFLGVAWGTPGADWLGVNIETVIVNLGYLGLLLIVYEGGLSTSLQSLKANLARSSAVAVTGIAVPVGLSFILGGIAGATPLQSFAAGAALCSTSLGTTFTVLGTSGLTQSRLGVVLSSAAMMDDVVGLVMVQIISNLGQSQGSVQAATIVRPLMVAVALAVCAPLVCLFIVKPITLWVNEARVKHPKSALCLALTRPGCAFVIHTAILFGCVVGANYAGTSSLFAAYIAGACISWWDSELVHPAKSTPESSSEESRRDGQDTVAEGSEEGSPAGDLDLQGHEISGPGFSGLEIYHKYYQEPVDRILRPFFFASIGFSIPITQMFRGEIVWKGIVYTVLMTVGKLVCGMWLLRISFPKIMPQKRKLPKLPKIRLHHSWARRGKAASLGPAAATQATSPESSEFQEVGTNAPPAVEASSLPPSPSLSNAHASPAGSNPTSVYPSAILGCAMVARGEIGFLISSVAESNDIFASESDKRSSSEIFLIVTWAIVLCTTLGPLAVGLLVRRVKRLEAGVQKNGMIVRRDVLGAWGLS